MPPSNQELSNYHLRNKNDLSIVPSRIDCHKRSFFPTAVDLWNNLPLTIRLSPSLSSFKRCLQKQIRVKNPLYYYGQRWPTIHHARMHIGCSQLNFDLCRNLHVIDSPFCTCGAPLEDAFHFFFICPRFDIHRAKLRGLVEEMCPFVLDNVLFGDPNLSFKPNSVVFDAVHEFIIDTQRFH